VALPPDIQCRHGADDEDAGTRGVGDERGGAAGRLPAVVFNHSHGGGYTIGKKELVEGRSYLQPTPYAMELTDWS
jgi:hypothetical protein